MKKIILVTILILSFLLLYLNNKNSEVVKQKNTKAHITELYIYGNHLNIRGFTDDYTTEEVYLKIDDNLVLELESKVVDNVLHFSTNDLINQGFDLESIKIGKYKPSIYIGDQKYDLVNETSFLNTDYYSFANNLINFDSDLNITVSASKEEVYDIVIDPGHGGTEPGASYGGYLEKDINIDLSLLLKQDLEKLGFKVFLTREDDSSVSLYGDKSRTSAPFEKKAKLYISLHHNATRPNYSESGVEIYIPNKSDYSFAQRLVDDLVKRSPIDYSTMTTFKVDEGIYLRTFSEFDINSFKEEYQEDNIPFYDQITTETNYYFAIRETGGYITGAYTDGRNLEKDINIYRNSNVGAESLLLELGYIDNYKDLKIITDKNNQALYSKIISENLFNEYGKYLKNL